MFFSLLFGKLTFIFLAGFILGYLVYANIHFYIHLHRPIKRFSFFWRHHSLHHYKYPDKAFGVSSPLWDIIFGTMPPRKQRQDVH
jgi:sterol desaturase/sphingolipid hydroxylase (fatty acid hydroxylase superfamily)